MERKVVIITGGASGIGKATALLFAKRGAKTVVSDVSVEEGEKTVHSIKTSGGEGIFLKCDVSNAQEVKDLINKVVETYGHLDYAFNNAGIEGQNAFTADCSEENWDRTLNINLKGIFLCMKYEINQMLKQKGGVIVNNSSVAGFVGFPGLSAYTASKHGIIGLTKTAALEYAKSGIRVNAICPGVIRTAMVDRTISRNPELETQFLASEPVGRFGMPEEVAEAVIWLCSEASSFVTGHAMLVDGGFTAQ